MMLFILVCVIYGIVMVASPETVAKKENKGSPEALKKLRRNGVILIGCGVFTTIAVAVFQAIRM